MLGSTGIPLSFSCSGSWLLLPGSRSIMMGGVVLPLTPQGSRKQRKVEVRVNVDLAMIPGPPVFLHGTWVQVRGGCTFGADVAAWLQGLWIFEFLALACRC